MNSDSAPERDQDVRPPRHCPTCGQDLSEHPYYQLRPSPFAGKLLWLAKVLIPVMAVFFLYLFFSGNFLPSFSVVSGYFILVVICGPSLLLYSVTLLIPRTRRVICLHCSWYRDYPFRMGTFEARPEAH